MQEFNWFEARGSWRDPVPRDIPLDLWLHLQKVTIKTVCASADAVKELLQLQSATCLRLVLKTDHVMAVTDEIRQGRCNVQTLNMTIMRELISEVTEAVQALARAI